MKQGFNVWWVEFRRSPAMLAALPSAVMFGVFLWTIQGRRWEGVWPDTSAIVQQVFQFVTPVVAAVAAVSARARVFQNHGDAFRLTRRPAVASVARVIPHVLWAGVVLCLGSLFVAALTLRTATAGAFELAYLLLGVATALVAVAVGELAGRVIRHTPSAALIAAAVMFVANVTIVARFGWLVTGAQITERATWSGALGRCAAGAVLLLTVAVTGPFLRRARRAGGRAGILVGSMVLAVTTLVGASSVPALADRPRPSNPVCTHGAVRFCLWPEQSKYLPSFQTYSDRAAQLRSYGFRVRPAYWEEGLQLGSRDAEGFSLVSEPWMSANQVASVVVGETYPWPSDCGDKEIPDSAIVAGDRLTDWVTYFLAGEQPASVHVSSRPGGPTQDPEGVFPVMSRSDREQRAFLRHQAAVLKAGQCVK